MGVAKVCQWCESNFVGKINAKFCSDHCRWSFHSQKVYAMKRDETLKDIDAILEPDGAPKRKGLSGRGAKRKGEVGERQVCAIINKITGEETKRKLGQAREGGGDVDWGPFLLEVKNRSTVSMPAWQQQVCTAVEGTDQVPAVVWKRKAEKFWIALPFEDFVQIFDTLRKAAMENLGKGDE